MFGKFHVHNVFQSWNAANKTYFWLVCFLALKHFFIKVVMQRGAEDPEELFPNLLLEHYLAIFWWGQRRGRQSRGHGPALAPLCLSLCAAPCWSFGFLGAEIAFLSSVGPTHGTVPPCFVLRLCGFSGGGISDIQKGTGAAVPTTAGGIFVGCTPDTQQMCV